MYKKLLSICAPLLVALLGCAILLRVYAHEGVPYTHDGENHLARFANYAIAVREGQLPPRFAPNLLNHYGYPVFNFNYPLANILSLPFSLLRVHYEATFKLLIFVSALFGSLGVARWIRMHGRSVLSSSIAQSAFILGSGFINIVFFRGNIGEAMVMGLLPWILVCSETRKKSAFFLSVEMGLWLAFFLSHNIMVLIATPLLVLHILVSHRDQVQVLRQKIVSVVLALAASMWFWVPALVEKSETVLGGSTQFSETQNHVVTLSQLVFSRFHFGYSVPGSVDSLDLSFGLLGTLAVILTLLIWLKAKKLPQPVLFSVGISTVLLLAQLPWSAPLWEWLPLAAFVQFPWRVSLLAAVLVLPAMAYSADYFKPLAYIYVLLLITMGTWVWRLQPLEYLHKDRLEYQLFAQTTSTQNENRAKTFTYLNIGDWQPEPQIVGSGSATVSSWTGSKRTYSLNLSQPSLVIEPTMLFSGWETTVNGKKISYAADETLQGRLGFQLEPGTYEIKSQFTQNTPARVFGTLLSAAAIALSVWWARNARKFI